MTGRDIEALVDRKERTSWWNRLGGFTSNVMENSVGFFLQDMAKAFEAEVSKPPLPGGTREFKLPVSVSVRSSLLSQLI